MTTDELRNSLKGGATTPSDGKLGDMSVFGDYPHYDTKVIADFNDLQYRMNVLVRKWAQEHYPNNLLLLYEFQGWYEKNDEVAATIILDDEHGLPDLRACRAVYTALYHQPGWDNPDYQSGYTNMPTVFAYFSDSSLNSIYVEVADSPFLESNYVGDFPANGAYMALAVLRDNKGSDDFFEEGYITYRIGVLPTMAEPVYQFGSLGGEFNTVGVNTMRVNVPPGYDLTIPHTPWPGIDDTDDGGDDEG